jgi:hypothetical protein
MYIKVGQGRGLLTSAACRLSTAASTSGAKGEQHCPVLEQIGQRSRDLSKTPNVLAIVTAQGHKHTYTSNVCQRWPVLDCRDLRVLCEDTILPKHIAQECSVIVGEIHILQAAYADCVHPSVSKRVEGGFHAPPESQSSPHKCHQCKAQPSQMPF